MSAEPAALRAAERHGPANRIAAVRDEGIVVGGVAAKKGDGVSRRREPQPLYVGILRFVGQVIDVVRGEAGGQAYVLVTGRALAPIGAVGEGPLVARDDLGLSMRPLLPRQHGAGHALLDGGIEVVQDLTAARQRVHGSPLTNQELVPDQFADGAAVDVRRHRQPGVGRPRRPHIGMPAAPDEREAASHQKSVSHIGAAGGGGSRLEGEGHPSAIGDAIEQSLIPLLHVDRFDDDQIDIVFDVPARVPRGRIDVDDPRVSGMLGVDFAEDASPQNFVPTHLSEDLASESRRFDRIDHDSGEAGFLCWGAARLGGDRQHQRQGHAGATEPSRNPRGDHDRHSW